MSSNESVTANFVPLEAYNLSVSPSAGGSVTDANPPVNINCPGACSHQHPYGASVTLTATPAAGYTFVGWNNCSSSTATCNLTITSATSVVATFEPEYTLSVTASPSGGGSVSDGGSLHCPGTCSQQYAQGTNVTLTATAAAGYALSSWSSCPSPSGATCQVTMNGAASVTATFTAVAPTQHTPTVSVSGSGSVTDGSGAINCPSGSCSKA
jgi:uncharacterized repeat protein (TIGR02543 family)